MASIVIFCFIYTNPFNCEILNKITDTKSIISLTTLIITAPIVFIVWAFRDQNKLLELENARKDINLKEFQQLQRWATGNIEGDEDNADNKIALQISALHSLRGYLKGEYGESFRRGAYEIFRASLATQHQKILQKVKKGNSNIADEINRCSLTKQLNIIAHEEWFNLLINHNFPTNNISLLGVDLQETYLHHRIYGKTLDLSHAQLQGANLSGAQLQGANLWRAQLQGADLYDAQLQGADLTGAQLQGVYLGHNFLNVKERIEQRTDKDTDSNNLEEQYQVLDDAQKSELITMLKTVGSSSAKKAIGRIKSASEELDLSNAMTGTYSKKEADKWLKDYLAATKL